MPLSRYLIAEDLFMYPFAATPPPHPNTHILKEPNMVYFKVLERDFI